MKALLSLVLIVLCTHSFGATDKTRRGCATKIMKNSLAQSGQFSVLNFDKASYCYFCQHNVDANWYYSYAKDKNDNDFTLWQLVSMQKVYDPRSGQFRHFLCKDKYQEQVNSGLHVSFIIENYWSGVWIYTHSLDTTRYHRPWNGRNRRRRPYTRPHRGQHRPSPRGRGNGVRR